MYPPERRRSSPQHVPPIRPRSWVARLLNPSPPLRAVLLPRYENMTGGRSSLRAQAILAKLFRRLEKWRGAGAKLLAQSGFLGLCGGDVPLLDVAESADLLRNCRKFYRDMMVVRRQMFDDLAQKLLVFCYEPAFCPALGGIAERIERRAAQNLEFRQQAGRPEPPRPARHLLRLGGDLVAPRQQRRRQGKREAQIVAVEGGFHPLDERGVGVKTRHFVFILIGHRLEQIPRDNFRQ